MKTFLGMSECSIPMLRQTDTLHSYPATETTSRQRNVRTNEGAVISATGGLAKETVATSFKSHEICRISTSFVLLHFAFILLL